MTSSDFEVTTIGPDWGASVIQSSLIAFLVSILLIIVYIAIRFEYKMGVMAIVALFHDLILVVGIYALVGREVNPNTIAALLTILGYSLYDTVVVFHRINDNMKGEDIRCTFMTMANHSMNQVFIRTINTTLTSFIPVFAMLLVRRRDAEGLRLRHGHRPYRRLVFVHRHRVPALLPVEDARAEVREAAEEVRHGSGPVRVRPLGFHGHRPGAAGAP